MTSNKRVKNIAEIQHVDLEDVRHSDLGNAIESLEEKLPLLEGLYKHFLDKDEKTAYVIRQVLEASDYLLTCYEAVR